MKIMTLMLFPNTSVEDIEEWFRKVRNLSMGDRNGLYAG